MELFRVLGKFPNDRNQSDRKNLELYLIKEEYVLITPQMFSPKYSLTK